MSVTPTITPDKKHVLLNITVEKRGLIRFNTQTFDIPSTTGEAPQTLTVSLPETEIARVQTRVNVPDTGTLLLGGQKVFAENEAEIGTPILSKIPLLGRLFRNNSSRKDNQVLLILVKPTIILQEETDAEALAALNENSNR